MNIKLWIPKTPRDIAEHLRRVIERWKRTEIYQTLAHKNKDGRLTDAQVKKFMYGHALFDDPPKGWSKRDLLMFGRGYLYAESVHMGNCAEELRAITDMLDDVIAKEQNPHVP